MSPENAAQSERIKKSPAGAFAPAGDEVSESNWLRSFPLRCEGDGNANHHHHADNDTVNNGNDDLHTEPVLHSVTGPPDFSLLNSYAYYGQPLRQSRIFGNLCQPAELKQASPVSVPSPQGRHKRPPAVPKIGVAAWDSTCAFARPRENPKASGHHSEPARPVKPDRHPRLRPRSACASRVLHSGSGQRQWSRTRRSS
jgi:hypothetical protein